MSLVNWIDLLVLGDDRGSLVAIEAMDTIPFEVKRVYYIFYTKAGVSRGFHAHHQLQQLAVCVSGKCRMRLDNGQTKEDVWLDSPSKGLLIGDMIWREMHDFSEDCVLLVLASEHYDEADYIRDYDEFKQLTKRQ
ncbi:sugar 3,4-ketoisomerase [Psychrobacter raelei]|uniref:sugar 3,4-ketoisomerase n=1 Tax=Psychrobacter raelei TaxID=2565531 RepID=UPI003F637063